jgi:hypothetical protein
MRCSLCWFAHLAIKTTTLRSAEDKEAAMSTQHEMKAPPTPKRLAVSVRVLLLARARLASVA